MLADLHRDAAHDDVRLWDDLLRAYAASIDEQRAFLLTATPDELNDAAARGEQVMLPPTFEPPASLPPMPPQLHGWAQALLLETQGLTALAADALDRLPAPAQRVPRPLASTGSLASGRSTLDRAL